MVHKKGHIVAISWFTSLGKSRDFLIPCADFSSSGGKDKFLEFGNFFEEKCLIANFFILAKTCEFFLLNLGNSLNQGILNIITYLPRATYRGLASV